MYASLRRTNKVHRLLAKNANNYICYMYIKCRLSGMIYYELELIIHHATKPTLNMHVINIIVNESGLV